MLQQISRDAPLFRRDAYGQVEWNVSYLKLTMPVFPCEMGHKFMDNSCRVYSDEVMATLLEAAPSMAPPHTLRAKVLARIHGPASMKELITLRDDEGKWIQNNARSCGCNFPCA